MFKNRAIKISLAKDKKSENEWTTTSEAGIDVDQIKDAVQETVAFVAVTAGFLYIGKKVVDTTSQIAIIAAEAKLK